MRTSSRRCVAQRSNCADRTASFRWSSVNSGEKPAGFYEELTQKTEPKFVKTSSVFFETDDIFRACFAITHLQKQGTAASEPPNNLRFLIKKSGEHAAGNAWKNWKHTSYLYQFYLPVSFQKHELHCRSFSEIAARSSAAARLWSRNFSIIAQSNWQRELFLCLLFWLPHSTCRHLTTQKTGMSRLDIPACSTQIKNFSQCARWAQCGLHGS